MMNTIIVAVKLGVTVRLKQVKERKDKDID